MKRHLLLLNDRNNILFKLDQNDTSFYFYEIDSILKNNNNNILKKILLRTQFNTFFFGSWIKRLDQFDLIIMFDSDLRISYLKTIRKINKKIKIIVYYRNTIATNNNITLEELRKYGCEIWSYNEFDCQKYNLKYNNQVWNKKLIVDNSNFKYDVLFIGRDKGRIELLDELVKYLDDNDLKHYFYLITDKKRSYNRNLNNSNMKYEQYLRLLSESHAVIDLIHDINYGLTIRPLEAMFNNKKLITNFKEIKNYDIFIEQNIFIWNESNTNELIEFLKSNDFVSLNDKLNKYDVDSWLMKFLEDGSDVQ